MTTHLYGTQVWHLLTRITLFYLPATRFIHNYNEPRLPLLPGCGASLNFGLHSLHHHGTIILPTLGLCINGWLIGWSLMALSTQFRSYRTFNV